MPPNSRLLYVALIAATGVLALLHIVRWLRRSTQRRKQRLAARDGFHAVHRQQGAEEIDKLARDRGMSNIESQFSVTRRLVIPLTLAATLLLGSIPFISSTPGAFVSMTVAAVTVIVGIAAKPMVENAIAGLVISSSKLINIGDVILIDDHYGTVEDITPTHTTIKIWDWRRYVLPNSQMLESKFINYSLHDRDVWAHVEFWVSYDTDIDSVAAIATTATQKSKHLANREAPAFWVMEMGKEGVRCWVAGWAHCAADAWMLTHDIRSELMRQFRALGISSHIHRHSLGATTPTLAGSDHLRESPTSFAAPSTFAQRGAV